MIKYEFALVCVELSIFRVRCVINPSINHHLSMAIDIYGWGVPSGTPNDAHLFFAIHAILCDEI